MTRLWFALRFTVGAFVEAWRIWPEFRRIQGARAVYRGFGLGWNDWREVFGAGREAESMRKGDRVNTPDGPGVAVEPPK